MYKCPYTGLHSFGVIHFIGEEGPSSYSPEYFETQSEHIELVTHAQGVVAYTHSATPELFTGI